MTLENAARVLAGIQAQAELLGDELDPERTFTHPDEATRKVIKTCQVISRQTSDALSFLRVTGVAP